MLELRVGAVEGVVVPVEAAARLGDVGDERQQDGTEERVLGVGVRVGAREDRRRRLAAERLERDRRVAAAEQPSAARLDEAPDERPVLVERRPAARSCSSKTNGISAPCSTSRPKKRESAEAEAAQG